MRSRFSVSFFRWTEFSILAMARSSAESSSRSISVRRSRIASAPIFAFSVIVSSCVSS
jgi:hypothetical protein